MTDKEDWVDIGSAEELARTPLKSCKVRTVAIAISFKEGQFGAVSNVCNHVGGPLGEGRLDDDYITCPWHGWKFHRRTGVGEPGFEEDRVPAFAVKVESGRVLVNVAAPSGQFVPSRRRRMMANVRAERLLKTPAEPSPELRIPGAAAQTRVVSMAGIRLGSWESARARLPEILAYARAAYPTPQLKRE